MNTHSKDKNKRKTNDTVFQKTTVRLKTTIVLYCK